MIATRSSILVSKEFLKAREVICPVVPNVARMFATPLVDAKPTALAVVLELKAKGRGHHADAAA
jgi:hypothetical protein